MTKIEFYSFIAPSRQKQYQPLNLVSVPRPRKRVREAEDPHRTDEFIKVRQEARTLLERERNKRKANIDILQQEIFRLEASKDNATNPETKERIQDIIDNYKEVIQNAQLMIEQPTSSAPTDDPFALQYQGRPAIEPPQYPAIEEAPNELSELQQATYDNIITTLRNDDKLDASLGLQQLKKLFLLSVEQRKQYINNIIRGHEQGIIVFKNLALAFKEVREQPGNFTPDEIELMKLFEKSLTDTLDEPDMSDAKQIYDQVGMIEELEELKTDEDIVEKLPEEIRNRIKINIRRRTKEEKEQRADAERKAKEEKDRSIKAERDRLETVYAGQGQKKKLEAYLLSLPPVYGRLGKERIEKFIADNQTTPKGKSVKLDVFRKNTLNLYKEALDTPKPQLKPKPPQTEEKPEQDEAEPSQPQKPTSTDDFKQGVLKGFYEDEKDILGSYDKGLENIPDVLKTPKPPSKQPESQAGPSQPKPPEKPKPTEQPKPKPQAGPSDEQIQSYLNEFGKISDLENDDRNKLIDEVSHVYESKKLNWLPEGISGGSDEEANQNKLRILALNLEEFLMNGKYKFTDGFVKFISDDVIKYIIEVFKDMKNIYNGNNSVYARKGEVRTNKYIKELEGIPKKIKEKYKITEQEPVEMTNPEELQLVLSELDNNSLFTADERKKDGLQDKIGKYIRELYESKEGGDLPTNFKDDQEQEELFYFASSLRQKITEYSLLSTDFIKFVITNVYEYLISSWETFGKNTQNKKQKDDAKTYENSMKEFIKEITQKRLPKSGRGFKKNQIDKLIMSIIDILEGQRQINMGIFSQDELLLFKSILDSGMTQKEQDKVEGILKGLKGKIGGLFDKQYPHKQTKPYYLKR